MKKSNIATLQDFWHGLGTRGHVLIPISGDCMEAMDIHDGDIVEVDLDHMPKPPKYLKRDGENYTDVCSCLAIPAPYEHHSSTVPAPCEHGTNTPRSSNLVANSSNLESCLEANASCPASPTTGNDSPERKAVIETIVSFLNLTVGTNYKANGRKTCEKITARLNEGFTLDDFKTVILKKHGEWGKDPQMCKYLRPETLFGPKFESYLNQPDKPPSTRDVLAELYHEAKEDEP